LSTLDPNADRAVLLDRRMRERLGTSLRYVLGEAAAPLGLELSMLDRFLLYRGDPKLSAEIRQLVREVVPDADYRKPC
jgi:hypothetical protein